MAHRLYCVKHNHDAKYTNARGVWACPQNIDAELGGIV